MFVKISSIIVTYNPSINALKKQLVRLFDQVQTIIIIDNGSSNSVELIKELSGFESPNKIIVYENGDNKGLGYAQNKGIEYAITEKATHILLLDDDSLIEENFVSNLLSDYEALINAGIKVGAIGPTYYNEETGEQYPITKYVGPFIDRKLPKEEPVEASFLIASGCLIPTSVIQAVGLMNEDFFIDYIDVEWSFRAISKGYKLFATPGAQMNHVIGEKRVSVFGRKISLHSPLRKYYLFRNSIFMIKCPYISNGYKIREIIFNLLRLIVYLMLSNEKKSYIRYTYHAYLDGFRNKKGKCEYHF
jgi:rhamnosyltransferase